MRYKILLLIFLAGVLLQSCEDFLDEEPLGQETDQNFFNEEENAIYAINACYDILSWDESDNSNHNYEFIFGDILSDDADKGSLPSDFPEILEMEEWRTTSNNSVTGGLYNNMFTGIFRCNTTLKNIVDADIDEELKNRLIGEATFLRGYYYFYLVRVFGGVPLFTEPVAPSEFGNVQRATIAEVYAQIDEDFSNAAALLPEKSGFATTDLGRATKGAANAFLSRSIMYQIGTNNANGHTWQEVSDLTDVIINSGEYRLVNNYATIYEMDGENNGESIFEVQCASNNVGWGAGKTGTTASIFQGNRGDWGWGFNNPTQDLADAYEENDPRKAVTLYGDGDAVHGVVMSIDLTENSTGYLNRKAALEPAYRPSDIKDSPANLRRFRYADILLMKAEAAYHLGNETVAKNYVNMVRERARQCTYPLGYTEGNLSYQSTGNPDILSDVTASGTTLLDAIYHERRVELGMENLRYWDLVRTGRYLDALSDDIAASCLSHCITGGVNPIPVLPIPTDEVQTWGLEQNPGY